MKFKYSLFFLFLSVLLFSACSSDIPDCSTQDTTYQKYSWDAGLEQCALSQSIQKDVCGNGVVEEGETYCSCEKDVSNKELPIDKGGCSGNKGEFLEYQCSDKTNACELKVTNKVKLNSKLINLKAGNDFGIDATINYFVPFMKDRHTVDIELLLKSILNTDSVKVKNIEIKKAYVVTKANELLGSVDVNKKLNVIYDTVSVSIPLDSFSLNTFDTEKRDSMVKFLVTYTKETYSLNKDTKKYDLVKSEDLNTELLLGFESKFQIIDPENKGEDLEKSSGGWG